MTLRIAAEPRRSSAGPVLSVAAVAGLGAAVAAFLDPLLALVGVVGIAGAVGVYLNPRLGLVALGAFTVLRLPDIAADFHGAPSLYTPLVALILFTITLRSIHLGERPAGGWRAAAAVGGFATIALGSLLFASDLSAGFRELGFLVKDGSVAVLVGLLLTRASDVRLLVWVVIGGGLALSTITTLQYLTGAFDTVVGGFAQSAVQNIVDTTDDIRISGPIGDPNFYAQWLVMIVPLAIDRYRDETSTALRTIAAAATVMCVASIVFSFSRGALLGLGIVLGFMVLRQPPKARTLVAILAVGLVAIPVLPAGYIGRIGALADIGGVDSGTDPSIRYRQAETAVAVAMFLDHPLTGVGYGNYLPGYTDYARSLGTDLTRKPREAHNLYLETLAETGVPGFLVLGGVFVAAYASLAEGRRRFRDMGDLSSDGIGHAVAVSLGGYLLTSVFLHMAFARLLWLIVGIALAYPSVARSEDRARDLELVAR